MALIEKAMPLSGGAGLNFSIIGGTEEPINPKENTIWINTDINIGEYQFLPTEPTTRSNGTELQEGDVWFLTGFLSAIPFNALKTNCVMIYPVAIKQYVGNTWNFVGMKCYQQGQWHGLDLIILDANGFNLTYTGDFYKTYSGGTTGSGSVTINSNNIKINSSAKKESEVWYNTTCCHDTLVDTTGYSTLEVAYSSYKDTNYPYSNVRVNVGVAAVNNDTSFLANTSKSGASSGTLTVDISNINQKVYIKIVVGAYFYDYGGTGATITGIKLY